MSQKNMEKHKKTKICMFCKNEPYLEAAKRCIENMKFIKEKSYLIQTAYVGVLSISEAHFQNAQLVILLAVPEPRALILSTEEASQLGLAYKVAIESKRKVLVIIAVKGQEGLQDTETVHPSFKITISSQPELLELHKKQRVISVAFDAYRNEEMTLNHAQTRLLEEWAESDDQQAQIQDKESEIQRGLNFGESSSSATGRVIKLHMKETSLGISEKVLLKVAHNYLAKYRHIILWGSGINPETKRLHDFYTDMAWKVSHSVEKQDKKVLQHYTDMLKRDRHSPNRRVCVWGDAGIGKSVFMAKLCQDWALVKTNEKQRASFQFSKEQKETLSRISKNQQELLQNIELLVCFILRDIQPQQKMKDMIGDQLNLNEDENKEVSDYIDAFPASVLLVFDGLDEVKFSQPSDAATYKQLFDILEGKIFPQVGYIVTCRPFAAYNIKLSVDAEIELKGFNEHQAKDYITKYYCQKFPSKSKEQNKKEATELWQKIQKSHDLLEMALNPSMLQLICLLYTETGKIGNDRTHIFKDYTRYLLAQYHAKYEPRLKFKEDMYHEDLMKIGKLALSGLQFSHLQLIFTKNEITKVHEDKPFIMGFVTELPANQLTEPKVQFLHKSLQEYLAAYFIVNSPQEEGISHLMQFCSTSKNLMGSQMIVSFISVMSKNLGKIVQKKVKEMISEWENKEELEPKERLKFLYTMLKTDKKLVFPLPKEVDVNIEDYEPYTNVIWHNIKRFFAGPSTLERLFGMESNGVIKVRIIVGGNTRLQILCNLQGKQLTHLELNFNWTSESDDGPNLKKILSRNRGILALKLASYGESDEHYNTTFSRCLTSSIKFLENVRIVDLAEMRLGTLACHLLVQEIVKCHVPLKFLNISGNRRKKDTVSECADLGNILAKAASALPYWFQLKAAGMGSDAEGCAILVNNVSLQCLITTCIDEPCISNIGNASDTENLEKDLPSPFKHGTKSQHLSLSKLYLNADISKALLSKIPLLCSQLHCFNLSGNNLKGAGSLLANVLDGCSQLQVLDMSNCKVDKEDLEHITAKIRTRPNIKSLGLMNIIQISGVYLGKIVNCFPYLETVDLTGCNLDKDDVKQVLIRIQDKTNISTLKMARNNMRGAALGKLAEKCPKLAVLDLRKCSLNREDFAQLSASVQHNTNITSLQLSDNALKGAAIGQLTEKCPKLVVLDLSNCNLNREDFALLSASVQHNSNITSLQLAGNALKGAAIGQLTEKCPKLAVLDLSNCSLNREDFALLSASVQHNSNITSLQLAGNALKGAGVGQLVSCCPDLRTLDLGSCRLRGEDVKQMVANMPQTTSITTLRMVGNNELTGAEVGQLVSCCPDLRSLDLGSCRLRGEDVKQMVANMPRSITALRMAGNVLYGGEADLGRLLQRLPALQQLDVWCCVLSIPDLLQAAGRDALTNMRFLDLGANYDLQLKVSSYLASVPRLQALSVSYIGEGLWMSVACSARWPACRPPSPTSTCVTMTSAPA